MLARRNAHGLVCRFNEMICRFGTQRVGTGAQSGFTECITHCINRLKRGKGSNSRKPLNRYS